MDRTAGAAQLDLMRLQGQAFDAMDDAGFIADAAGLILAANPAAERLYGRPRAELIGLRADALHGPGAPPIEDVNAALEAAGAWTGEMPLPDDGHGPRVGQVRISALYDESGRRVAAIAFTRDVTAERRTAADLGSAERRLEMVFEVAPIGLGLIGLDGFVHQLNHQLSEFFGFSAAELRAMRFGQATMPDDVAAERATLDRVIAGEVAIATSEHRYRRKDGRVVWGELSIAMVRDEATGLVEGYITALQDITQRRLATERLTAIASTQLAFADIELSPQKVMREICQHAQVLTGADGAMVQILEGHDIVIRAASGTSTGAVGMHLSREGLAGRAARTGQSLFSSDTEQDPRVLLAESRTALARSVAIVPLRRGTEVFGLVVVTAAHPNQFTEQDVQTLDVLAAPFGTAMSNAWQLEDVSQQASTDGLTGLTNRPAGLLALDRALKRQALNGGQTAVVFIDLDRFKPVNDALGHGAGDQVLVQVAERLRAVVRSADIAARYGGDEFLVICADLAHRDDAARLADRLLEVLPGGYPVTGPGGPEEVVIGASIGVAVTSRNVPLAADLLRAADEAMYVAKQSGGNRRELRTE